MKQIILLGLAVVIIITACVAPRIAQNQPLSTSFASPLIPATNLALVANRWQLVAVQHRATVVNFAAIKPVYIWFDLHGTLSISSSECSGGAYRIVAENERRYKLTDGWFGGEECGAIKNAQFAHVIEALKATTTYELDHRRLRLTGSEVQMDFEADPRP